MPTFDTPEPISATISLIMGHARITAGDRDDTVVVVEPSDNSNESDVKAAERTRVEYSHGSLVIKTAKQWATALSFGHGGSVEVTIDLPAGSRVDGEGAMVDFECIGRLGDCALRNATGNILVDQAGPLHLTTGTGTVTVDHVVGCAEVTGAGDIRVGQVDGPAVIKSVNGDTWIGEVTGDLHCKAANGSITVDRAHASVEAKTANGNVRFGDVARGSAVLETALGTLEVGVRHGTSALLDVRSRFGRVDNSLAATEGPGTSEETLEVRARTSFGDIVVHRA